MLHIAKLYKEIVYKKKGGSTLVPAPCCFLFIFIFKYELTLSIAKAVGKSHPNPIDASGKKFKFILGLIIV